MAAAGAKPPNRKAIGTIDMTPEERKQKRKLRDRDRKRSARRANGLTSRDQYLATNSKSRRKPWEAAGVSRATYYRLIKAGVRDKSVAA